MAKFPEIGEMVERVIIQRSTKVEDEYHGKCVVWHDIAEVWAKVEPISGREYFFAQANQAEVTHKIQMRYRPDIGPGWRIKHRGFYYAVESAIDIAGQRRFLDLHCIESKEDAGEEFPGGDFLYYDLGTFIGPGTSIVDLGDDS